MHRFDDISWEIKFKIMDRVLYDIDALPDVRNNQSKVLVKVENVHVFCCCLCLFVVFVVLVFYAVVAVFVVVLIFQGSTNKS